MTTYINLNGSYKYNIEQKSRSQRLYERYHDILFIKEERVITINFRMVGRGKAEG